jgi:uncharacterized membrane protein
MDRMEMDERTMIDLAAVPLVLILPVCLAGGLVLGFAFFSTLRISADMIVMGDHPFRAMALTLGRFVCLGAGLYVAVLAGSLALLATFTGLLCAKWIMLRRMQEIQT